MLFRVREGLLLTPWNDKVPPQVTVCQCPVDVAAGLGHFLSMVPKRTWACPSHCSPGVVDCSGTFFAQQTQVLSARCGVW